MKFKILMILSLATMVFFAGCKSETNTNTMNANVMTNTNMVTRTPETANTSPMMENKIQDALKAKGFTDVTVDTSTTPATLRGTVAKGKMAEVMQVAMEANGGKPVKNEVVEK